jgi:hypothetical protein
MRCLASREVKRVSTNLKQGGTNGSKETGKESSKETSKEKGSKEEKVSLL